MRVYTCLQKKTSYFENYIIRRTFTVEISHAKFYEDVSRDTSGFSRVSLPDFLRLFGRESARRGKPLLLRVVWLENFERKMRIIFVHRRGWIFSQTALSPIHIIWRVLFAVPFSHIRKYSPILILINFRVV